MKKKTFDCMEMKRQAQQRIWRELESLTVEQRQAWWMARAEAFEEKMRERRKATDSPAAS